MRVLVLGGTKFVGRHVVEAALARGDELTLFNRGRTAPRLFDGIEQLRGDRGGDLDALRRGGPWDVAIDISGYEPDQVAASSRALADRVEHLTFVSTISVYAGQAAAVIDEDAALDADGDGYGPRKARCEQAVHAALPERALVVRPGVIAGPHDPTNRFSWWVARLARGGRVLVPGAPDRVVQLIDARDLAAWILDMAQRRATGVFNAVGPQAPLTMEGLLRACDPDAELVWVADEQLLAAGVQPWDALPLWIPRSDAQAAALMRIDGSRAWAVGLRLRPLAETARDVLASLRADGEPPESERARRATGLDRAVEARLLASAAP